MVIKTPVETFVTDLHLYEGTGSNLGRRAKISCTDCLHVKTPGEARTVIEKRILKIGEGYAPLMKGLPRQFERASSRSPPSYAGRPTT